MDDQLARKLARADAGLAPEDVTVEQANFTATLRQDPDYVSAWITFEEAYDRFLDSLASYTGRHGL